MKKQIEFKRLTDFPAYRDAVAAVDRAKAECDAATKVLAEFNDAVNSRAQQSSLTDLARQALAGGNIDEIAFQANQKKASEAYKQRSIWVKAEELARRDLEEARCKASQAICEEIKPEYAQLIQDIIKRAEPLVALAEQMDDLLGRFRENDIAWTTTLRPMAFCGNGATLRKRLESFKAEAQEYGLAN